MAWIESHTVLSRHRKMKELARSLRLKPVYVMGHLHALWHDALEQQEDGDLTKWSDELIAESSQFDGDIPRYVSLLQEHGWLDGRLIHDWLDYAGGYLAGKYHSSNREKLITIWAKHGKEYGRKKEGSEKEVISIVPDLTIPTLPTKPTITPGAKSPKFVKPSHVDVQVYAQSIGFKLDAEGWCDHYEANGWRVGKNPMKDWKATVRQWKRRKAEFSPLRESMPAPALPRYKEKVPKAEDIFDPSEKGELNEIRID